MKKILIGLLIVILIAICYLVVTNRGTIDVSEYEYLNQFEEQPKVTKTGVSFAIIQTAIAETPEAFVVKGGSWFRSFTLSHSAIFIKHPKGNILFDTGLGSAIDEQFDAEMPSKYKPLMKYEKTGTVKAQLLKNGFNEDSISMIIPSHMHWDHAGGLEDLINTPILITDVEKVWALANPDEFKGTLPSQYDDPSLVWKSLIYTKQPFENFDQYLDFYGDGSIILLPVPGHTPGSVTLLLTADSGKKYIFTGDLTWSLKGLLLPADKFSISSSIVDNNPELLRESMIRIHFLKKRYPELKIIPAHDNEVQAELGFFPTFVK